MASASRPRGLASLSWTRAPAGAARTIMTTTLRLFIDHLETPVGRLTLIDDDEGRLHTVGFEERHDRMERQLRAYSGAPAVALERAPAKRASADALERYFAGDLAAIDAL